MDLPRRLFRGAFVVVGGGMAANDEADEPQAQEQPQPKKKKKGFGLGDLLGGAVPVPH